MQSHCAGLIKRSRSDINRQMLIWKSITGGAKLKVMKPITVNDLLGMPVTERLRLVEDLWDSIAEVPEAIELSDTQRAELDQRLEAYHQDPDSGSPWKDVKERILKHG